MQTHSHAENIKGVIVKHKIIFLTIANYILQTHIRLKAICRLHCAALAKIY